MLVLGGGEMNFNASKERAMKPRKKSELRLVARNDWKQTLGEVYFTVARRLARASMLSREAAENCVTTACLDFLRQWRKSGPPSHVKNLSSYMLQSAFHASLRKPRKDERLLEFRPPVSSDRSVPAFDPPSETWRPLEEMVEREEQHRAFDHLGELPLRRREVLMLHCQGYSLAQVARMLHSEESYVRSLKHKALRKLQRLLGA
jgi:RNA polymerase sigma factor (sigma-70 family)